MAVTVGRQTHTLFGRVYQNVVLGETCCLQLPCYYCCRGKASVSVHLSPIMHLLKLTPYPTVVYPRLPRVCSHLRVPFVELAQGSFFWKKHSAVSKATHQKRVYKYITTPTHTLSQQHAASAIPTHYHVESLHTQGQYR